MIDENRTTLHDQATLEQIYPRVAMTDHHGSDISPMYSMEHARTSRAGAMEGLLRRAQLPFTSTEISVAIRNGSRQPSLRIDTRANCHNLNNPTPIYSPAVSSLSVYNTADMSTCNSSCEDFISLTPIHTPHGAFRPTLHGMHGEAGIINLAASLSDGATTTAHNLADNHCVMHLVRPVVDASQHLFETTLELCYAVSKGSFRYESIEDGVKLSIQEVEAIGPDLVHKRLGLVLIAVSVLRAVPCECILFDTPDRVWPGLHDFINLSVEYLVEVGICRDLAGRLIDEWCQGCNETQPPPSSKIVRSQQNMAEMANPDNHPIAVCKTFLGVLRSLSGLVAGGDIVQSPFRSVVPSDPQYTIVEHLLGYWKDEALYETLRTRIMYVACYSNAISESELGWHLLHEATDLTLSPQDLSRFYMQVAELCRPEQYLLTPVELGKEALHQLEGSMQLIVDYLALAGPPTTPSGDSQVVCRHPNCGKVFTGEFAVGNRRKHSQSVHETDPNDRPQCPKCGRRFARKDILQKHQTVTRCARRP